MSPPSCFAFILLLFLVAPTLIACASVSPSSCVYGVPSSGVVPSSWTVRSFSLVISSLPMQNLRGASLAMLAVNGTVPGPRLDAEYGDWVVVTVHNNLTSAVSALHWHGLSLYSTPGMDGSPGVTQCGIPAGGSMVYSFCAAPYGTFWYHGHLDQQYVQGLYGPLVIASSSAASLTSASSYQHDWVWQWQDFYNQPALSVLLPWFLSPLSGGQEPQPDAPLVNGQFTGSSHLYVSSGDSAVIRLINSGSLCMYVVSIDGLALEVIELDGTEVAPLPLQSVMLNVAQRAVIRVNFADFASRYPGVSAIYYRITMVPDADLAADPFTPPYEPDYSLLTNWTGVIHIDSPGSTALPSYVSFSPAMPLPPASAGMQAETNILDARPLNYDALVGGLATVGSVPSPSHSLTLEISFMNDLAGVNLGYINNITMDMADMTAVTGSDSSMTQSMMPQLYAAYVSNAQPAAVVPAIASAVIIGNSAGQYDIPYGAVLDLVILNTDDGEHPFHLHGSHFLIIASSDYPEAEFEYESQWLVRDTVSIPPSGWVKLRVIASNPGVWLLHCHIDWHMSAGLAVILNVGLDRLTADFMQISSNSIAQCDSAIQQQVLTAQQAYAAQSLPASSSSSSSGLSRNSKIAIGVAVGLGVPVLMLAAVMLYLLCCRPLKKQQQTASAESKQSVVVAGVDSEHSAVELSTH